MPEKCTLVYLAEVQTESQFFWFGQHRRGPLKGRRNTAGGKLDPAKDGQSTRSCALRELEGETGIVLHNGELKKLGVVGFHRAEQHEQECDVYGALHTDGKSWAPIDTPEMINWHSYSLTEIEWDQHMAGDRFLIPIVLTTLFGAPYFELDCYYDRSSVHLVDFRARSRVSRIESRKSA